METPDPDNWSTESINLLTPAQVVLRGRAECRNQCISMLQAAKSGINPANKMIHEVVAGP